MTLPAQLARVSRGGVVGLRLVCRAGATCRGSLTLSARLRAGSPRLRTVVLGRARFSILPGHAAIVRVRLSTLASRVLAVHRRLAVTLRAAPNGAVPVVRRISLVRTG